VRRIDGDGHQAKILSPGELLLELGQLQALGRAGLRAFRVDEVRDPHGAPQIGAGDTASRTLGERKERNLAVPTELFEVGGAFRCRVTAGAEDKASDDECDHGHQHRRHQ
jgi:hypothetical protein